MQETWTRLIVRLVMGAAVAACGNASDAVEVVGAGGVRTEYPGLRAEAEDEASPFFQPLAVRQVALTISDADLRSLENAPSAFVKAGLHVTGDDLEIGPCNVGVRLKGKHGASFRPIDGKPALKIDFDAIDESARPFGLRGLILNNLALDWSGMHEALALRLFREAGLPASRTTFAQVSINGVDKGLYAAIEAPDEGLAVRWFETTRHLYEADGSKVDLVAEKAADFIVRVGDADVSDLGVATEALAGPASALAAGVYAARIDWYEVLAYLVVERLVSHDDGYLSYGKHYLVHVDGGDVLRLLPWALDEAHFRAPGEITWRVRDPAPALWRACSAVPDCKALRTEVLLRVSERLSTFDAGSFVHELAVLVTPFLVPSPKRDELATQLTASIAWLRHEASCVLDPAHDLDGDGSPCREDCLDTDPAIHPGPDGSCSGVDVDCDGVPESYVAGPLFLDVDRDGHGDPTMLFGGCPQSGAYSPLADDCNDADVTIRPGAPELGGDGIDQDCSGHDDCFVDADGDGFGGADVVPAGDDGCATDGQAATSDDCDDDDPSVQEVYPKPVSALASSEFGPDYSVDALFDASVCPSDVGVTTYGFNHEFVTAAVQDEQFSAASVESVSVVLDFGARIATDTLLYANRNKDWASDRVSRIHLWFRDTAITDEPPAAAPDADVVVATDLDGDWQATDAVLAPYALGACFQGRYVALRLFGLEGGGNIGGSELRLAPCSP